MWTSTRQGFECSYVILQRGLNKSSQSGGKTTYTMSPETCGVYTEHNYNLPLALDSSDVKRVEHVERYSEDLVVI